jgi:putative Mn2+ efflux pump MntP
MTLPQLIDVSFTSTLMGLAIGLDVMLATLGVASSLTSAFQRIQWVVGVTATHTLFPLIGYLLTYYAAQHIPALQFILGLLAFICIAWFLYSESQSADQDVEQGPGWLLILAISWDALWSGPAKSAQAQDWSELLIVLSFIIAGLIVALGAWLSLTIARCQNKPATHQQFQQLAPHCQQGILAYFGWAAFFEYSLSISLSWWMGLILAVASLWVLSKVSSKHAAPQHSGIPKTSSYISKY